MLKKSILIIGGLIGLTIIVNLILSLIATFLPVKFVMPESVVEAPKLFEFVVGNIRFSLSQTVLNTWAIMLVLIVILKLGTKNLSIKNPSKMQIVLEEYYKFIENVFLATYGDEKKKFVPFFSALFALILFLNLSLFLFPFVIMVVNGHHGLEVRHFFRIPTADLNTTVGLAIVVLILSTAVIIRKGGWKTYFKKFFEPMWFMFPLNVVEQISKVLNTSMRLYGNMLAGLVIGGLLYGLVRHNLTNSVINGLSNGPFSFAVGWPMAIQVYLDFFVGIIQAVVFTMLSAIYVGEALEVDHHEEHIEY